MQSPFSGMDPFIEAQGKWEDFHNKLMGDLERHLSETLPERYAVRLGERSYIDCIDPRGEGAGERTFLPDVAIKTASAHQPVAASTSILEEAAVEMDGLIEAEVNELFIEIHEVDPNQRLVTCIEVLSPTNKRPNSIGWNQYERKRRVFLEGHANLVEIDLLRGGRRHAMAQPWPDSPYYLLVLRKENAPRCRVFAAHYREPLPVIPIPLTPPDEDVPLSLQPMIESVYRRSRYFRELDYAKPLHPPLPESDSTWLQTRLAPNRRETP